MERVIVITGGSSGLGAAVAELYAGETVVELSRTGRGIKCDVTDEEQVRAAFAQIRDGYGRIDLLICNAGLGISGATELLPMEQAAYVMDVDFYGVYRCVRHALPLMGKGGKIVTISSACALFALPFRAVYCAAKSAVSALSYGLRMELARYGVTVVTICPGDVKTNFTANRLKVTAGGRYGDDPVRAARQVDGREHKRMDCKKTAEKIRRIADRKKGALYIIGAKYKALWIAKRLLPTTLFLRATNALFNQRDAGP